MSVWKSHDECGGHTSVWRSHECVEVTRMCGGHTMSVWRSQSVWRSHDECVEVTR